MTKTIDRFELDINGKKLSEMTDDQLQELGVEADKQDTDEWEVKVQDRLLRKMNVAKLMQLEIQDPFYDAIERAEESGQSPLEAKVDGQKVSQMTKGELLRYTNGMAIAGAVRNLISRILRQRMT